MCGRCWTCRRQPPLERANGFGENTGLVAALSPDAGVTAAMTLTGAVDGAAFKAYVKQVFAPPLRPRRIVVMARFGAPKGTEVREDIGARGCEPLFLPSYSPDLTPTEQALSKFKAFVKRLAARTRSTPDSATAAALEAATLSDVLSWFKQQFHILRQTSAGITISAYQTAPYKVSVSRRTTSYPQTRYLLKHAGYSLHAFCSRQHPGLLHAHLKEHRRARTSEDNACIMPAGKCSNVTWNCY